MHPGGVAATMAPILGQKTRTFDEAAVRDAVLDHGFRAALHRLRGVQALLVGWAEIGVVGDEATRVRAHHEEGAILLARLEWLHGARVRGLPLERLVSGEAPRVLLAAAACNATPEEAGLLLPEVLVPDAALALALWVEAQRPDGEPASVRFAWQGNALTLRIENAVPVALEAWHARWGTLLTEHSPGAATFRPGCFRPVEDLRTAADAARG